MGVRFDNLSFGEAVERLMEMAASPEPQLAVTPNVDHVVRIQTDEEMRQVYHDADLVLCDGMPLKWAMRWLGKPLKAKISGSDLLPALCREAARRGLRPFFLGAAPGVAQACADQLRKRFPDLRVAGVHSPPWGFEDNPTAENTLVEAVRAASPDMLFVALGTPRQEKYIRWRLRDLGVPMTIGVGAAIDFTAGVIKRAPAWMRHAGLEWLWRLVREPRRLYRRYLIDDMRFFRIVWREWRRTKR